MKRKASKTQREYSAWINAMTTISAYMAIIQALRNDIYRARSGSSDGSSNPLLLACSHKIPPIPVMINSVPPYSWATMGTEGYESNKPVATGTNATNMSSKRFNHERAVSDTRI